MTFQEQRLRDLLKLFADNEATEVEVREMLFLIKQDAEDKELESIILNLKQEKEGSDLIQSDVWENMWESIRQADIQPVAPVIKMYWHRVAAAVIILMLIGTYFWYNSRPERSKELASAPLVQNLQGDIKPGGDKAILTLGDGSQIVLDSTDNGQLAVQGNSVVVKLSDGQLTYQGTGGKANEVLYNIMSTPRGGQYKLVLPDGSKVWLNSISSIRYPTAFTGKERKVEITGEVYFEVAKNPSHPFKVMVAPALGNEGMEVEVLGTHFNVNAYTDEPSVNTTLLEGSVKVVQKANSTMLKPGQQARIDNRGAIKIIPDSDVEAVVAWKDGRFIFRDANLKSIMRQIMRWYDVEVKYEGHIQDRFFTADISRNKTLSGVLKILELSNVDFKLKGKVITVIQ